MDKSCEHHKIDRLDHGCYLFTWSIPTASWINELDNVQTKELKMNNCYYRASLDGFKGNFSFCITTSAFDVKCSVSLFLDSGTLLHEKTLKEATRETLRNGSQSTLYHYDLMSLSYDSECYSEVKNHPFDTLIFICRIKLGVEDFYTVPIYDASYVPTDTFSNMKKLAYALKNFPKSSMKEKVILRVGAEDEIVNKAVLCAGSPVFADMFNTTEVKDNVVTMTDIEMDVLKALVSFLYTGKLTKSEMVSNDIGDFDFFCDLYCAAVKYGIPDLRHACIDQLLTRISLENIFQASKFAFAHSDERLKSTVKSLIATNIDELIEKNEWKDMMRDLPEIAVEALNFYDLDSLSGDNH